MVRRNFLKKGAYATLGTLASTSALSSLMGLTSCSDVQKTIGLQLYSLRNAMKEDVVGTLELIAEMGYKNLETAGYADHKIYGYAPLEIKKIVGDLGMKITSAHIGKLYNPEEDVQIMDWWKKTLDNQAEVGAKYTIFPHFPIGETLDYIKMYSEYFNKVAEISKSRGVQFGFHNHAQEFEIREDQVIMDYLIENASEDMIFELDVYWAMKGGVDPVEYIKKYGHKFPVLHIKDESIIGDSGLLDFQAIFNAAYKAGMKDYYVEVERYSPLPAEGCVQKSFEYLESASFVK